MSCSGGKGGERKKKTMLSLATIQEFDLLAEDPGGGGELVKILIGMLVSFFWG